MTAHLDGMVGTLSSRTERQHVTARTLRLAAAGALTVAAVAAPIAIALTGAASVTSAEPCLAWYGSRDDGICLSYSNGYPVDVGTPGGIYGPGGNWQSGPIIPGQTWNRPIA